METLFENYTTAFTGGYPGRRPPAPPLVIGRDVNNCRDAYGMTRLCSACTAAQRRACQERLDAEARRA